MKTNSEKDNYTGQTAKSQVTPRLQEAMSIAQREQSVAFKQFFKSLRRADHPQDQSAPTTRAVFGARSQPS